MKLLKIFYKKYIALPGPKELGKSKINALESKRFNKFTKAYSWEDYYIDVEKLYPIRFVINQNLIPWAKRQYKKLDEFIYRLKCIFISKQHLIDIRQDKDSEYYYRYGYISAGEKILLANFTILKHYVESGELLPPQLSTQLFYNEVIEIYNYWTLDRKIYQTYINELNEVCREIEDEEIYTALRNKLRLKRDELDKIEEDMLLRLMKIRKEL